MLTQLQAPYTGPYYGPSHDKGPMKGPTAIALKRALSRLGFLPWREFDDQYNKKLEEAMRKFQGATGIKPTGQYGRGSWTVLRDQIIEGPDGTQHRGEYALDFPARTLLQNEAKVLFNSEREQSVQGYISEFWTIAISNAGAWHYDDDFRPVDVNANPREGGKSDCSGMVIQARSYAKRKTGLSVLDPAKQNWTGFGNTDWYEDDWPKVGAPFRVGDLAHFHSSRHVIECITAGSVQTAVWGSNGREAAPELVRLATYNRYPDEFLYVVRPAIFAGEPA